MTRIPAHAAASILFARSDDVLATRSRTPQAAGPGGRISVPRLRPAWWTRLATHQLRQIPLGA